MLVVKFDNKKIGKSLVVADNAKSLYRYVYERHIRHGLDSLLFDKCTAVDTPATIEIEDEEGKVYVIPKDKLYDLAKLYNAKPLAKGVYEMPIRFTV